MFCNLRIFTLTRLGMAVMGSKPDLFESFREACMGGRWDIRKRSFEFPSPAFSQPLTAYTHKLFLPETRRLADHHGDSRRLQGMKQDLCPNRYQPLHYHPARERFYHTTGVYASYSLWIVPRALFPGFGGGAGKGLFPPRPQSQGKAPWGRFIKSRRRRRRWCGKTFHGLGGNEGADIDWDTSPVSSPVTVLSHRGGLLVF